MFRIILWTLSIRLSYVVILRIMATVQWGRLVSSLTVKEICVIQATIRLITFEEAILLAAECPTEAGACKGSRTTICAEVDNPEEAFYHIPNSNRVSGVAQSNSTISMVEASTPKEAVSKALNQWANNSQQVSQDRHLCQCRHRFQVQIYKTNSSKAKGHLEETKPITRPSSASSSKVGVNVLTNNDAHLHIAATSWEPSQLEWTWIRWEAINNTRGKPEDSKLVLVNNLEDMCFQARCSTPFTQMVECSNTMACNSLRTFKVNSTKVKPLSTCRCYQVPTWTVSSFKCSQCIINTWVSTLQASSSKWWLPKASRWTQLIFSSSFSSNRCPVSFLSTLSQLNGS